MWRRLEPIHAVTYFAPASIDALKQSGLRGFWMCYFAARAAPMGAVTAPVVEATFYNFAPRLVRRAVPDAWSFADPTAVLAARAAGAEAALAPHLDVLEPGALATARGLLDTAVGELVCDGRSLAAANAALDVPVDDAAAVWQHLTTLREHRGDGHLAALVVAGLSGLEAHLTLVGTGSITREILQAARGFTDEEWEGAASVLRDRGVLDGAGALTAEGRAIRQEVEDLTDRAAAAPWARLGDAGCDELARLLVPLSRALSDGGVVPAINPIGVPRD
jgi:hypothetical protein